MYRNPTHDENHYRGNENRSNTVLEAHQPILYSTQHSSFGRCITVLSVRSHTLARPRPTSLSNRVPWQKYSCLVDGHAACVGQSRQLDSGPFIALIEWDLVPSSWFDRPCSLLLFRSSNPSALNPSPATPNTSCACLFFFSTTFHRLLFVTPRLPLNRQTT